MTTFQELDPNSHSGHHQDPKAACTADVGLTEAEIEAFSWGTRGIFEQMPKSGSGFDCYSGDGDRYGLPEVIQVLKYVCAKWDKLYTSGPRVGIGDISYPNGGPMPPHSSHQHGVDVDIALVASTHEEIGLTWEDSKYSRQRTQQLIDLFRNNPILNVRTIFFNDPNIQGVEHWAGHDNHFHVSFFSPGVAPAAHSSDQQGSLKLVSPPMKGDRVRQLQEDLVKAGFSIGTDGIFGAQTDAAVRRFQDEQGLEIDGAVGPVTQAKLAQVIREQASGGVARGAEPLGLKLQDIVDQNKSIPFENINAGVLVDDERLCTEIQTILRANGLLEVADGLYGPKTREALRRFKASHQLGGGDVLGATTAKSLLVARPAAGALPDWQGGDKQATIQAIIQEARRQGINLRSQIAYILATVQHETNDTFQPVREAYFLGEPKAENYRQTLRYYPFYGRGYVQLTWDFNYREYSNLLALDLVNEPDLVMRPEISLFVLIDGMKRGVFTGVGMDQYITDDRPDFRNARRIINGLDEADRIVGYAMNWQIRLA
ncbi:MAG: penicillin-insensitive murein endopeptidase [Drouetiella hepatica Uher 2000/2452]|jgi:peptidoglycan hydrolase-like protein with peptidoglycan-binding domain|uniref:Penicillin-insensitive murein endopeptidase n=1 Tax=Drouetiella hepatica Uher 2000/2452 TaxID=904376 RepID=A0A951QAJ5_9CYAN|nr:penicillin-insensitive murein endopeptidase [Drouetiella hepatica Uher 2000/2452]